MSNKILLSSEKIESLKEEYKRLEKEIFLHDKTNVAAGTMAYSFKDAATEEMVIEAKRKKLKEIKAVLKKAEVLTEKKKFRIVHPIEADPVKGLISSESPLGKGLIGKGEGQEIILQGGQTARVKKIA